MLSKRQELILKLIVEEFIKTADPVGSKSLAESLNFSSATIRNEMAELEELDYIEKTHTSSGRVPSDKGYHYYIEKLLAENNNYSASFNVIDELFASGEITLDELSSNDIAVQQELIKTLFLSRIMINLKQDLSEMGTSLKHKRELASFPEMRSLPLLVPAVAAASISLSDLLIHQEH